MSSPAHGDKDRSANIAAALEDYNALVTLALPVPSADDLTRLADGETIALREYADIVDANGDARQRILVAGYQIVQRPRLLVWLATLDVGTEHSDALTEHLISTDDHGSSVWYQHMDVPWPIRNRHWVIHNSKNLALARLSNGLIWQHEWQLLDGGETLAGELLAAGSVAGLDTRDGSKSIYLALNRGAWTMIDLGDDTTLVAANALAEMGGWIPDDWVAGFVSRQLGHVLQNLTRRADQIHAEYVARPPVYGGDGMPIAPAMARQAWLDYSTPVASGPRRDFTEQAASHE